MLGRFFKMLERLTAAGNDLAATFEETTDKLRDTAKLDEPKALPAHDEAAKKGRAAK